MSRSIDGERVRRAQATLDKGGSQADAARAAGVTTRTIRNWRARGIIEETKRASPGFSEGIYEGRPAGNYRKIPRRRTAVELSEGVACGRGRRAPLPRRLARPATVGHLPATVRYAGTLLQDQRTVESRVVAGVVAFRRDAERFGIPSIDALASIFEVQARLRATAPGASLEDAYAPVLLRLFVARRVREGAALFETAMRDHDRRVPVAEWFRSKERARLLRELGAIVSAADPRLPVAAIVHDFFLRILAKRRRRRRSLGQRRQREARLAAEARRREEVRQARTREAHQEREAAERARRDQQKRDRMRASWLRKQESRLCSLVERSAERLDIRRSIEATFHVDEAVARLRDALAVRGPDEDVRPVVREVAREFLESLRRGDFE